MQSHEKNSCSHAKNTTKCYKKPFSFDINLARMVTIKMGILYPTVIILHLLCIFSSCDEGYM